MLLPGLNCCCVRGNKMDDIDRTDDREEFTNAARLENIARKVQAIPQGEPGECVKCGDDMPRLVKGVCCRCRDKLGLP